MKLGSWKLRLVPTCNQEPFVIVRIASPCACMRDDDGVRRQLALAIMPLTISHNVECKVDSGFIRFRVLILTNLNCTHNPKYKHNWGT